MYMSLSSPQHWWKIWELFDFQTVFILNLNFDYCRLFWIFTSLQMSKNEKKKPQKTPNMYLFLWTI